MTLLPRTHNTSFLKKKLPWRWQIHLQKLNNQPRKEAEDLEKKNKRTTKYLWPHSPLTILSSSSSSAESAVHIVSFMDLKTLLNLAWVS